MNKQEIFDKVATHLLAQNERSIILGDFDSHCAYRGEDGLKCAAGCLIPDEEYSPDMEKQKVNTIPYFQQKFPEGLLDFVRELQDIHDSYFPFTWKDDLKELAKKHNLTVNFS